MLGPQFIFVFLGSNVVGRANFTGASKPDLVVFNATNISKFSPYVHSSR